MYQLEKYQGPATRYTCPECSKSKQFTRYVDDQGNYLADHVGKCNREIKCGYHYTPKQYFEDNNISKPVVKRSRSRSRPRPASLIDVDVFKRSLCLYTDNNFISYLNRIFDSETVYNLITKYKIGTSKHWPGAAVFWQIDQAQNIRSGKIMLYNPMTGKRIKKPYNHINWVHSVLDIEGYNLKQCLFGEHLLRAEPLHKLIGVVESEKTAIIAAAYMPDVLFLAVGSLNNLKYDILRPLKGRKLILYPDLGCFDQWKEKTDQLKGFNIEINGALEKHYEDKTLGYDIADILIDYKLDYFNHEYLVKKNTLDEMISRNPALDRLIKKFDLELKVN